MVSETFGLFCASIHLTTSFYPLTSCQTQRPAEQELGLPDTRKVIFVPQLLHHSQLRSLNNEFSIIRYFVHQNNPIAPTIKVCYKRTQIDPSFLFYEQSTACTLLCPMDSHALRVCTNYFKYLCILMFHFKFFLWRIDIG